MWCLDWRTLYELVNAGCRLASVFTLADTVAERSGSGLGGGFNKRLSLSYETNNLYSRAGRRRRDALPPRLHHARRRGTATRHRGDRKAEGAALRPLGVVGAPGGSTVASREEDPGETHQAADDVAVALRRHPDVGLVSCAPGIAATARMGLANLKAQHQIGPVLIHNGLWRNGGHRNYPHNALVGHKRSRTPD